MDNFLHILSRPDNMPIAGMVVALVYLLLVWFRQARKNDRLIEKGQKDEIGREMRQ